MREKVLTVPELVLIAGTRVALGVGVGLLIAGNLDRSARKAAGLALLAFGAWTSIPIAMNLIGKRHRGEVSPSQAA
jgi:hypothetical protein